METAHELKGGAVEGYVNELAYESYIKYWCYPMGHEVVAICAKKND